MNREIEVGSVGWIVAGVIAIGTWYAEANNYVCPTCSSNVGLLIIGICVVFVGLYLVAFNRNIEKLMRKMR